MNNIKPIFEHSNRPMNIAVFISGSGTNLKALCKYQKALEDSGIVPSANIKCVFTNVPDCKGSKIAKGYDIPVVSLSSKKFFESLYKEPDDADSRKYYDAAVISLIENVCSPDLIVLAGYRRKLSTLFYEHYKNKIINLYPGDITKEYLITGVQAPIQALKNNETEIKATVYLEQESIRFGIPILQSDNVSLEGYLEDNIDIINKNIREQAEWVIFPHAVYEFIAKGRLGIGNNSTLYLDYDPIGNSGIQYNDINS
ncbi:MAG TPA: formyltransferase family protein [Thermodesulfobacteriota bacterium]|nr:formyltransferase family protein [Thermodesulfobacteriota bacterium]